MSAEIATQIRRHLAYSTDPAWVEREARIAEGNTGPRRVQAYKTRLPPGAVWVGDGSPWQNHYTKPWINAGAFIDGKATTLRKTPENLALWYRQDLTESYTPAARERHLAPLRGKDLACRCAIGSPCHADVLLELANR